MHPKLDYSELTNTVYIVFGNNHHKKIDVTEQFNRLRTVLTPLKQARSHSSETIKKVLDSITPEEQAETERKMLSGEPGNEAKKDEDDFYKFLMKELIDFEGLRDYAKKKGLHQNENSYELAVLLLKKIKAEYVKPTNPLK
jgi:hypothetical protein